MKRLLLLSLGAGMTALIFSSYATGPFMGGAGNRTGSGGSIANCSTGGCHAANSANTPDSLIVQTMAGVAITQYTPGVTYKVLVLGGTTGTSFPKFGFQASCVKAAATSTQAGTFAAGTGMHLSSAGGLSLVEHSTPLGGTVVAGNTGYSAIFNWTAPAKGTGDVKFFAMLNAVNGNNATSGDQPGLPMTRTITEGPAAGVATVKPMQLSVYPNPVSNVLHMDLGTGSGACSVHIFNATGSVVSSNEVSVTKGESIINTASLPSGNYHILVQQGNERYAAAFAKL